MVLVHGRGASAADILGVAPELGVDDVAFVAPDAPGRTWYPYSFLAPLQQNEPYLSAALQTVHAIVADLQRQGIARDRIGFLGFSQGACLSLEYVARHATRYAAVIGFSGGLIGPPGTPRTYSGSLNGTPVFLGCSDVDPHIPLERVHETRDVLAALGAAVDERIYPGMGHTINRDEIEAAKRMLTGTEGTKARFQHGDTA
jgi:predicted esterase